MARGVVCDFCGVEARCRCVSFAQNIGAIVVRVQKSSGGYLCKRCIHRTFWTYTPITLLLGWWSITSLIIAPGCIILNLINYLSSLSLPPVPEGAGQPQLTPEAIGRLNAVQGEINDLLARGHEP